MRCSRLLVLFEQALRGAPPWLVLLLTAALGLAASRRWVFALACAAGMALIGTLGQWDQAMQTLALVLVSVAVCAAARAAAGRGLRGSPACAAACRRCST